MALKVAAASNSYHTYSENQNEEFEYRYQTHYQILRTYHQNNKGVSGDLFFLLKTASHVGSYFFKKLLIPSKPLLIS